MEQGGKGRGRGRGKKKNCNPDIIREKNAVLQHHKNGFPNRQNNGFDNYKISNIEDFKDKDIFQCPSVSGNSEPVPLLIRPGQSLNSDSYYLEAEQTQATSTNTTQTHKTSDRSQSKDSKIMHFGSSISNGIKQSVFPKRPDYGELGRPIKVKVNYFSLDIPHGNVYHYDVNIIPLRNGKASPYGKPPNVITSRRIIDTLTKAYKEFQNYYPVYDGKKNLITRKQLFSGTQNFTVSVPVENQRTETFKVVIKAVKEDGNSEGPVISLDELHDFIQGHTTKVPSRAIMALDIIMRHVPSLRLTAIGKSIYHQPTQEELHPLSGGLEVWFGYYQSVRPSQWKMMVNIDKSVAVFYQSQPVLQFIGEILKINYLNINKLTPYDIKKITKELRGIKIKVTHQNYPRKYKVFKLTNEPLSVLTFPVNVNSKTKHIKVTDYFREQYNCRLKYAHLPALDVGSKGKPKYLPLEVCVIVEGQHCKKKLSDQQTAERISFTAQKPEERFKAIEAAANQTVNYNEDYMKEFGLNMNTQCTEITARVLHPPKVAYDEKEIRPSNGVWDMKNTKFFKGVDISNWAVLSLVKPKFCTEAHLSKFVNMLCKIAGEVGIMMPSPKITKIITENTNVIDVLKNYVVTFDLELAIIILPDKNSSNVYSDIKNVAETEIGLKTQCVKAINVVRKCTEALITNLCQKINAKMGGVNCGLGNSEKPEILKKPVIFLGADVTHPSPGDPTTVSIAAVVGSLDRHPSRYAASVRVQNPNREKYVKRIEIIQDLRKMVKELLQEFYRSTRKKPEKIIFYRDGVSEGEFLQVQEKEVLQIREACKELEENYEPGITFIVVGKRHHMRMMPVYKNDGVGSTKNVPPGTTVDTVITHPTDFDFFLCSHFGIQGTSRPAHYTVLWDDNEFTADELQKLSYYLCHTYVRCTRSISIPSPVQYAHLAAARAKQHLISKMEISTSSSESSGEYIPAPDSLVNSVNVVKTFKTAMYYV